MIRLVSSKSQRTIGRRKGDNDDLESTDNLICLCRHPKASYDVRGIQHARCAREQIRRSWAIDYQIRHRSNGDEATDYESLFLSID
jgi:hypothetical protein